MCKSGHRQYVLCGARYASVPGAEGEKKKVEVMMGQSSGLPASCRGYDLGGWLVEILARPS